MEAVKFNIETLPTNILVDGDYETREVYVNGKFLNPIYSLKIRNHSPDGFNWGYGGSGPAQLALAILMRFMDVESACNYYQSFKFNWVAALPKSDFEVRLNLKEEIEKIVFRNSIKNEV